MFQTVGYQPFTVVAQVQSQVCSCGIYGGQSVAGAGFLQERCFPPSGLSPLIAPFLSCII